MHGLTQQLLQERALAMRCGSQAAGCCARTRPAALILAGSAWQVCRYFSAWR